MRVLRKLTGLVGIATLTGLGLLLIAEATNSISGQWRSTLADALDKTASPALPAWQLALTGTALAVLSLLVVAAEFTRPPKGTRILHNVHNTNLGSTEISGRAAINAAKYELSNVDGIIDFDAAMSTSAMTLTVQVDDQSDLETVETEIRDRLNHEFWIKLGLADIAINIFINHHVSPPRVR